MSGNNTRFLEERIVISDGLDTIVGILHRSNLQLKSVIILVHGFNGSKDGPDNGLFQLTVEKLLENEFSVFRFDFRGNGESSSNFKDMTIAGQVKDLDRVIRYMKHLGFDKIGVVGNSLGATISIKSYNNYVNCMVLWFPLIFPKETNLGKRFISEVELEEAKLKGFVKYTEDNGKSWEVGNNFIEEIKNLNLEQDIECIRSPTLLIHAEDDTTVDIKQCEYVFGKLRLYPNEKKFERIKSGGHNFIGTEREAIELTVNWFNKWLK